MDNFYRGRSTVVTGGLGFIGSNLALRLAGLGAQVTIIDSQVPGCGANPENLCPVSSQIRLLECDIGDREAVRPILSEADVILNLAGEVSNIHSVKFPQRDLQINALAHLQFLTECAVAAPGVRLVYASTRQVYGVPRYLPVDESHPVQPVDFNGVHKHATEQYHDLLTRLGQLDAIILRLSNVYGPRMGVHVPCQGFLPVFFRKLLCDEPIEIYGDGRQLRDPVYVDDVVEALLRAAGIVNPQSRVYNIGGPQAMPIQQIARTICEVAGVGAPRQRPFPEALRAIDIGGFASDCRRAQRELSWTPRITLEEGVTATLAYFRANWLRFQRSARNSECLLREAEPQPAAATA